LKRYKKPRYRRRTARTEDLKARSMQASWRVATNRQGTLSIADAKEIIKDPPNCPYCEKQIDWRQLSIDHVIPWSREGTGDPDNLVWSCRECNSSKGSLTGDEYKLLLEFLNQHPLMKENVLSRMRAGGAAYGRKRRRRR
jgi:5-methylcytosine-specific restriction endonuclease McrA